MCKHEWIVIKEEKSTCTETGKTYLHCRICEKDTSKEIKKLGHDLLTLEYIEPTVHSEGNEVLQCSRCRHKEFVIIEKIKCEHEWKEATCFSPKTCTICETTKGNGLGHNLIETSFENPTVLNEGKRFYACSRCNHKETNIIPAKKDSWNVTIWTSNKTKAQRLAEYGEETFISFDFDEHLNKLRDVSFGDLTAEIIISYNFEEDYDKENHTLHLECELINLKSQQIDSYYINDNNSTRAENLAGILKKIRCNFPSQYTYELDDLGTVIIHVTVPTYEFSISTPTGRTYTYNYGTGLEWIDVDGNWIFSKESNPYESIYSSNSIIANIPYKGMDASDISRTNLGEPDKIEPHRDYYSLRPEKRSVEYRWYNSNGDLEFYAYALAGEIVSVTDYR